MELHDESLTNWVDISAEGGDDIFAKAYHFDTAARYRELGMNPYFRALDGNEGPEATIDGKNYIMLGSNNYLGLTTHPKVREAAREAITKYGTSLTGSRFLNGTLKIHQELEEKLAAFVGKPACAIFTTGYQANLGVLSALLNEKAVAIVDRCAHASIHDGCSLGAGKEIKFQHNDAADLDRMLRDVSPELSRILMIDGIYSMEGDAADLPNLLAVAKRHKARGALDDAHGFGFFGPGGRGTAHHFGVADQIDLFIGTFSKSLASIGGFVAGDSQVIEYIRYFGRPMIFSASLVPSCIAAAGAALDILIAEPELAEAARKNGEWMRTELKGLGLETGPSVSPVVPIGIGDELLTIVIWKELMDRGIYTNPVIYPAVGRGKGILRTSCMATHTKEHLSRAMEAISEVTKSFLKE